MVGDLVIATFRMNHSGTHILNLRWLAWQLRGTLAVPTNGLWFYNDSTILTAPNKRKRACCMVSQSPQDINACRMKSRMNRAATTQMTG